MPFGVGAFRATLPFWDPLPEAREGVQGPAFGPPLAIDPWDMVIIGGDTLPGICSVKGEPTLAFDKKKAGGVDGATITVNGYLPGPITIECLLWTPEQWVLMQALSSKLWTKPNKRTKASALAKSIRNPAFALWGITDVIILGVSVPEKGPIWGTRIIKIKCVEFVAQHAVSKTKTPKSSVDFGPITVNFAGTAANEAGPRPEHTEIHPAGSPQSRVGGL